MTPRLLDVDEIGLTLTRSRHLVELIDLAMGDGIEGDMEMYCRIEALCNAIAAQLDDVIVRLGTAPDAPRDAAVLIDPDPVTND